MLYMGMSMYHQCNTWAMFKYMYHQYNTWACTYIINVHVLLQLIEGPQLYISPIIQMNSNSNGFSSEEYFLL